MSTGAIATTICLTVCVHRWREEQSTEREEEEVEGREKRDMCTGRENEKDRQQRARRETEGWREHKKEREIAKDRERQRRRERETYNHWIPC